MRFVSKITHWQIIGIHLVAFQVVNAAWETMRDPDLTEGVRAGRINNNHAPK